jgi:molybdopterin converting factor small subunit
MAKVTLNLLNIFQLKLNKKFIEYEGSTIREIISKFLAENKEKLDDNILSKNKKKLHSQILILLNGRNIKYLDNYKTTLRDGDELYISFPLAGG